MKARAMIPAIGATIWCAATLLAQYPGQYPPGGGYPPGQYPPGQYPPGRNPRGGYPNDPNDPRNRQPGGQQPAGIPGRSKKSTANKKEAPIITSTTGIFRRFTGRQFVMEADDHRIIWLATNSESKFLKDLKDAEASVFQPGDHLSVDSTEDSEGMFTLVSANWMKEATPSEKARASQIWDLPRPEAPSAKSSGKESGSKGSGSPSNDDDRPRMRRASGGKEAEQAPAEAQAGDKTKPIGTADTAANTNKVEEEPVDNRPKTVAAPAEAPLDEDDPGRPVLRRGAPAPRRPVRANRPASSGDSSNGPVILTKSADGPKMPPEPAPELERPVEKAQAEDPAIARAREVAMDFHGTLPNFLCQQMTTRYQSENPRDGWQPLDVVSADVTYEDGKESYKNIKIGNKSVNKSMDEIGGSRSTGEFASILADLFSPYTAAAFKPYGTETISGRDAKVFKFTVEREHSHWRIVGPSQLYYPAYKGTIWIDKETGRVLRLEQQSVKMPKLFPFDTIETAADYSYVRLTTTQSFLLPVDAEVLACVRGSSTCTRNRIEFRNYRKFGAESSIEFAK